MGSSSREVADIDIHTIYQEAGLEYPQFGELENQFEKEIFMAINIFRHSPSLYAKVVQKCVKTFPEFAKDSALADRISAHLEKTERMNRIGIDQRATLACRQNNKDVVEQD